jgi:hypothetical protein
MSERLEIEKKQLTKQSKKLVAKRKSMARLSYSYTDMFCKMAEQLSGI